MVSEARAGNDVSHLYILYDQLSSNNSAINCVTSF